MKMKILIILFFPISILAQVDIPNKEHKTVLLQTSESDSLLFNNFINYLLDNNYQIDNENKERKTLTIPYKDFKYLKNYKCTFNLRVKDNTIYINGSWKLNLNISLNGVSTENSNYEWHWVKAKNITNGKMHQEIIEILKGYCGECKILYK